jgi:hypothetical protein
MTGHVLLAPIGAGRFGNEIPVQPPEAAFPCNKLLDSRNTVSRTEQRTIMVFQALVM